MARGGYRPGAGRKPKPRPATARPATLRAEPKLVERVPAEPKQPERPVDFVSMLPMIEEISRRYATSKPREKRNSPFNLPKFPTKATPPENLTMAMDNALVETVNWAVDGWAGEQLPDEGLAFLGYSYLAELAQRPEYRIMSETIADDATREWIDFDVVGDEKQQREARERDPEGHAERMADPDEKKKRVEAAGKMDKVKALRDDQLRLEVKHRFYEQARNDGFMGRSHLFIDLGETGDEELKTDIGDGRNEASRTKVPKGAFKDLRTVEAMWTYPLMYNAQNPLQPHWYRPQNWYVMGREVHISRLPIFVGHPVPDILKPAYAFGGLSLTQIAKPYVDIWLRTKESVGDLIHAFSVMVLSTDVSTQLSPSSAGQLLARVAMFNMLRDNQGAFVVNKNTEDFKNVSAPLGGLHELQAQAQEHMAAVARIPLVKFTGIQPMGLNASSDGEIAVYDDSISAYQQRLFAPNLTTVINFEQLSLFGGIDPEISWHFKTLRQMTEKEKGEQRKNDADARKIYVDMGAFSPGEIRKIAIEDPELPFTDLDPDEVPEPPAEEGLFGEAGGEEGGDNDNNQPPGARAAKGGNVAQDSILDDEDDLRELIAALGRAEPSREVDRQIERAQQKLNRLVTAAPPYGGLGEAGGEEEGGEGGD